MTMIQGQSNIVWFNSNITAWNNDADKVTVINETNAQLSPGVAASNYKIGQVVRVSDGALPSATYYYYKVGTTII